MKWVAVAACVFCACWLEISGKCKEADTVLAFGVAIAVFAG